MKKDIDFKNYKFSPHAVGKLMTEPKLKKDKEAGKLGQTTITYLNELYIQTVFGRKKDNLNTKEIQKGLYNEEDSLELVGKTYFKKFLSKNKERIENEYLIGTPDHIGEDFILDVKTSWDMFTHRAAELTKLYEWQLKAYCFIKGFKKAYLSYVLTDTPEHLLYSEINKLKYQMGVIDEDYDEDFQKAKEQLLYNHNFSDVPDVLKEKTFEIEVTQEDYDILVDKIEKARNYLCELYKIDLLKL